MTSTCTLRISENEVLQLLRAEMASTNSQPELDIAISKDYRRVKRSRQRTRGAKKSPGFEFVNEFALLSIEPRREHDYWVLRVEIETPIGLRVPDDGHGLEFTSLTMKEFDEHMHSPKEKHIRLRLETETPEARRHFNEWLSEMRKSHPAVLKAYASRPAISRKPQLSSKNVSVSHSRQREAEPVHQESIRKSVIPVDKLLPLARERLSVLGSRAPLTHAARLLAQKDANLVVVCDSAGKMVGVVTKTDVVRGFCSDSGSGVKRTVFATMIDKHAARHCRS